MSHNTTQSVAPFSQYIFSVFRTQHTSFVYAKSHISCNNTIMQQARLIPRKLLYIYVVCVTAVSYSVREKGSDIKTCI
jgi:hypothetical protein